MLLAADVINGKSSRTSRPIGPRSSSRSNRGSRSFEDPTGHGDDAGKTQNQQQHTPPRLAKRLSKVSNNKTNIDTPIVEEENVKVDRNETIDKKVVNYGRTLHEQNRLRAVQVKEKIKVTSDDAIIKSEAFAVFDELQTITKKQASIALELTKPSWDAIGYDFSLEDPNDPKTMELCVKRVTALLWIRLIAIGIMESVIEESELYGDSMNSNIDLSTTTLCRWILREPKEEARNPQDDAAEAGCYDAHDDSVSSDPEAHERFSTDTSNFKGNTGGDKKKFCYSKFSSEPLQVPCWWWPTEQQNMYQSPRRRNVDIPPKPWEILVQLRLFIQRMFLQHRKDLPFHNYTHSAVVVCRCNKLLDMILCTTDDEDQTKQLENDDIDGRSRQSSGSLGHVSNPKRNDSSDYGDDSVDCEYYDEDLDFGKRSPPAFGLRKDPIAQFALLFSGLIHDVQHHGVTNRQLCIEEHELSLIYNDQSVQEKNSLKIAFYELIKPNYNSLRTVLFGYNSYSSALNNNIDDNMISNSRYRYFRQTVVNAVLTTDIASPEQTVITKMKWKEAFCQPNNHSNRQGNRNQTNHQNRNQLSNIHVQPFHQLHLDRRLSVTSEVSLPQALTKGPINLNGRQPGNFNRRGSNVSAMSEFTDDSYCRNQQHARGGGVVSGGRNNFGKLETVRSQHQMKQDHEFEYNDDNNYSSYHANRRGSAVSTFSSDSVAMMNHPSHSHVQPRRISTSMRQRRPSNESLGSYNYDHQQRRRQSNESYAGQQYLQNNNTAYNVGNSFEEDDVSYDGSECVNDSEVIYNKNQGHGQRPMDRRMSAASYDSYSASDWGGDSVAHLNQRPNNRRDSPSSNSTEGIIQHHRYPHANSANGSVSNVVSDSFDKGRYSRNHSIDVSTTDQTLGSIAANSVEINKKRLSEIPATTSSRNNSNLKENSNANKVSKKIMMETDDGDEVDISRYVWKGDDESEGSFSLTPPSSVEDEYGGHAHEYAAQFKAGGTAGVALPGSAMVPSSMQNLQSIQNPKYQDDLAIDPSSGRSQGNGEYCGRVIVATTRTNRPIDRRSSVSGAIVSKGRPPVDHANASNSSRFMAGQMPARGRINRRASTGTFRVSGQSTALQGASIDENNPAAYGMEHHDKTYIRTHSMQATQAASRIRRGSLGTLTSQTSQDARQEISSVTSSQLNAFDYQSTVSNMTPDGLKKYKKRLGLRRSMDLSGESIETYSGHGESRLMNDMLSVESNEGGRGTMMDYDEPDEMRAAVVIETLLRVADVGHSIQNWENMTSWSSKLFRELCNAHRTGRGHDPRSAWYANQIGIMDSYLRPLAFQLDELGVFGEFNGVLFVQCVDAVRSRWIEEGEEITAQLIEDVEQSKTDPEMDMMRFL